MAKPATESPAKVAALLLTAAERQVLEAELSVFALTLRDPEASERYLRLGRAAQAGTVPPELVGALEAALELLLQTQRIRRIHGPEAEQTISELFYRTPRGSGLRRAAREVNQALKALQGQTLEALAVVAGPGRHTLVVDTDKCHLTLKLDGAGARVENVEVGG